MHEDTIEPRQTVTPANFYIKEHAPWRRISCNEHHMDKIRLSTMERKEFLACKYLESEVHLFTIRALHRQFTRFRTTHNPDGAIAPLHFTLGENAQLKILNPGKGPEFEKARQLIEGFNSFPLLEEAVQAHAHTVMTLVDHDTELFRGDHPLTLANFHTVIDYGQCMGTAPADLNQTWIGQVHRALKRFEP